MAGGGVNKAILIGNLGQDPEVRYTPSGSAVCNLSLATTESWKKRDTGERQEKTEWHRLVFFGRVAEIVGEYLHKGSQIYVEGRLQTRKWQDQTGNDRFTTEIIVSDMQILGRKSGGDSTTAQYDRPDRPRRGAATLPPGHAQAPGQGHGHGQGYGQSHGQSHGQGQGQSHGQSHGQGQGQGPGEDTQSPVLDHNDDIPF